MKTKFFFSILFAILFTTVFPGLTRCQFLIDWAKTYGGPNGQSKAHKARQTSDGGYIMVGYSAASIGDLTDNYGDWDYWIMKLDSRGNIEWSRHYGGSGVDSANDVLETQDGRFLVIGHSNSTDGDVTGNKGGYDCWVVKLDKNGQLLWQKSFGGSDNDTGEGLTRTEDGNFVFIGSSRSAYGDITGNKGSYDLWILKFNFEGDVLWSKNYGGSKNEGGGIVRLMERDLIVAGSSESNDGDVGANFGNSDSWVLRLNPVGEIIWETNHGGFYGDGASDFQIDPYGNIVVVSTINLSLPFPAESPTDIMLFKLDSTGKPVIGGGTYGGTKDDDAYSIQILLNGEYLIGGITFSKDGDVSSNYGFLDWWLFVIDKNGKVKWEKNYGGSRGDILSSMEPTSDGGFILGGLTFSQDHDVVPRYDGELAWIVKLKPENTTGQCIKPKVYPNPISVSTVKIEVAEGFGNNGGLEVFDAAGRVVLMLPSSEVAGKSIVEIPASVIPVAGVYYLRANCGEEAHAVKFVKL